MHPRMTEESPLLVDRWDDIRWFHVAARAGSFTQAAVRLGVEQSTVSRRIAGLEQALGGELFLRTSSGLHLTELGEALVLQAQAVAAEVDAFTDLAHGQESAVAGTVRVALTESFALHVVIPGIIGQLRVAHPGLRLQLISGYGAVDLTRREADIAVRFFRTTTGDLVSKRIAQLSSAVLARRDYLEQRRHLRPEQLDWIGLDLGSPRAMPEQQWLRAHLDIEPSLVVNSYLTQVEAVRAGLGVAALTRSVRRLDSRLVEVPLGLEPGPVLEVFLVTPRSLRRVPRVAAVWSALATALGALSDEPAER